MTPQTYETFKELREAFLYSAERRLELNPHDNTGHILHSFAVEIGLAVRRAKVTPEPHQGPDFS